MIEVQDLHKSFATKTGLVKAVQGVSFTARDGEITGLLGPNGAGKTTTLRMLYTLMAPESGRVQVPTRELSLALVMDDVLDRQAEGFSQGQRTTVAIARALVHDPKNVILDEPTNGLDVMTTRGLRDFLRQLKGEGRCVIFSSHIMQEVAALCDRIVVIAQGKVMAAGTPDEVRAQTGEENLEDAFVKAIGSEEGLHA